MEKKKVRLAFVGAGRQAQSSRLSRFYRLRNECELVALAEPKPEQLKMVAKRYDVKETYTDYRDLLKRADVDAYVITLMYTRHLNVVPHFLATGKPVFTEKPVAYSLEAAQKIVDCAKKHKATHMVGYQLRVDCAAQYAKKLMEEWRETGRYGKLQYIRITAPLGDGYAGSYDPILTGEPMPDNDATAAEVPDDKMQWAKNPIDPYNWCVNGYSHFIDLMRFFMGEKLRLAFAGKNGMFLVLEGSKSGLQGVVELELVTEKRGWTHTDAIYFEHASIEIQRPAQLGVGVRSKLTIYRDDDQPSYEQPLMPFKDPMLCEAEAFLKVVRGEMPPPCDSAEAMEAMVLCKGFTDQAFKR